MAPPLTRLADVDIQDAFLARLQAHVGFPTGTQVYDEIPEGEDATFPHIVSASRISTEAWDTKTNRGREGTVDVECFSRAGGRFEIRTMLDQVVRAITGSAIVLANDWNVAVPFRPILAHDNPEDAFGVRNGIVRFSFKVEDTSS